MRASIGNGAANGEHSEPVTKEPEKQSGRWNLGAIFRGVMANGDALRAISARLDVVEAKMDLMLAKMDALAIKK